MVFRLRSKVLMLFRDAYVNEGVRALVTSHIVLGFDKIQPAQSVFQTDVVEVVGLVNADRTVSEMRFTEFGNDMGE